VLVWRRCVGDGCVGLGVVSLCESVFLSVDVFVLGGVMCLT
jgi:hypothetical protein